MNIIIESYDDIPHPVLIKWIINRIDTTESILKMFIDILKFNKINVKILTSIQIVELFNLVDWSFLNVYPQSAIIKQYENFISGEASLKNCSAIEFYLIDQYYQSYNTKGDKHDKHALHNLTKTIYRKDIGFDAKTGDNREPILSQAQLENNNVLFPENVQASALMYAHANLMYIQNSYGSALSGSEEKPSSAGKILGWVATYMSIAETGIFGNFDQVLQTNIHVILTYMVKKNLDHTDQKK